MVLEDIIVENSSESRDFEKNLNQNVTFICYVA